MELWGLNETQKLKLRIANRHRQDGHCEERPELNHPLLECRKAAKLDWSIEGDKL